MNTNPDSAAGRIAAAMRSTDRSIKSTAEAAGIPLTTFRRKLDGHTDFTVSEIGRIAAALDVPAASLLPALFQSAA